MHLFVVCRSWPSYARLVSPCSRCRMRSVAAALLTANVHPRIVSEALEHASVALTLDTYPHVMPSLGLQAADAIQAALGRG
jgi:hypothetical protein